MKRIKLIVANIIIAIPATVALLLRVYMTLFAR